MAIEHLFGRLHLLALRPNVRLELGTAQQVRDLLRQLEASRGSPASSFTAQHDQQLVELRQRIGRLTDERLA